jgi:cell wall assembly regulator SMI1
MPDTDDIRELCQQILKLDTLIEGTDKSEFYKPGATDRSIDQAERASGVCLPPQLRELYRTFNGFDVEHWRHNVLFFQSDHLHLTVQGANNTMAVPRELDVTEATQDLRPALPARVFGANRIPFAHGRETFYFLDLMPSSAGVPGQVLAFDYGRDKVTVESQSLSSFLATAVQEMKDRLVMRDAKTSTERPNRSRSSPAVAKPTSPRTEDRIDAAGLDALWHEIGVLCSSKEAKLQPPAKPADLEQLERILGFAILAQWRASLLLHNGAYGLWRGIEMLAVAEVPRHLKVMADTPTEPSPRLRGPVQFDSAWQGKIPFACGPQGDFYCLDVEPPVDGVLGQVLEISWEEWEIRVVASSYMEFLHLGVGHLRRGDDACEQSGR